MGIHSNRNGESEFSVLADALKAGDLIAWKRFVSELRRRALPYFRACGVDRHTAEDLAQESCLRAYACIGQLRSPASLVAWSYRIMRTVRDDWLRDRRPRERLRPDFADIPAQSQPIRSDRAEDKWPLDGLSADEADLLYLRHVVGCPITEVAEITGRSVAATKMRLGRLMRRLRKSGKAGG